MTTLDKVLAIDFGSTKIVSAYYDIANGRSKIIIDSHSNRALRSCIAFTKTQCLFGYAAECQINSNARNTIRGRDLKLFSYKKVFERFSPLQLASKSMILVEYLEKEIPVHSEQLFALLLSKVKQESEKTLQKHFDKCIITIPSCYNCIQRTMMQDAAIISGFEAVQLISDTTAAAITYACEKNILKKEHNILMVDIGATYCQAAIIHIENKSVVVKACAGKEKLGGDDFVCVLMEYFIREYHKSTGVDLTKNQSCLTRLRFGCEELKLMLSTTEHAKLTIESFQNGYPYHLEMKRSQFENLSLGLFNDIDNLIKEVFKRTSVGKDQVEKVVLVGGGTRIPKIQQNLIQYFNGAPLRLSREEAKQMIKRSNELRKEQKKHQERIAALNMFEEKLNEASRQLDTMKPLILGIDIGASKIVIASCNLSEKCIADVIVDSDGKRSSINCLAFTERKRLFGYAALCQAGSNIKNTIFGQDIKFLLKHDLSEDKEKDSRVFNILFQDEYHALSIEETIAMILSNLKSHIDSQIPNNMYCVIPTPATYGVQQLRAIKTACEAIGLTCLKFCKNVTALSITYALENIAASPENEKSLFLLDMGTSSFEAALVRVKHAQIHIEQVISDGNLGGGNFSDRLYNFFIEQIKFELGKDLSVEQLHKLNDGCEQLKKILTFQDPAKFSIDSLMESDENYDLKITRDKFNDLCVDLFDKFEQHLKCIPSEKYETVDEVIVVGGALRTSNSVVAVYRDVYEVIANDQGLRTTPSYVAFTETEILVGIAAVNQATHNPENTIYAAVAYGYNEITYQNPSGTFNKKILIFDLGGGTFDVSIVKIIGPQITVLAKGGDSHLGGEDIDNTLCNYFIEKFNNIANGEVDVLFRRNTPIPCSTTKIYETIDGRQTIINLRLYEGEGKLQKDNKLVGDYFISEIPKTWFNRKTKITCTFSINENGCIEI
uniref:CSON002287 protein n=1 Tax=Culicoides sonorensis TaxID=179676 RepID=A0A336L9M2_CULSO